MTQAQPQNRAQAIDTNITELKSALQQHPQQPDLWYDLGVLLMMKRKNQEALQSFQNALKVDSNHSNAWSGIGSVLLGQQKMQEAAQALSNAVRTNPKNAAAHMHLGMLYGQIGAGQQAMQSYQQAAQLMPNHAKLYVNMAQTLMLLEQNEQAEKACEKALSMEPNLLDALFCLGMAYSRGNKNDKAIEVFERVMAVQPKFSPVFNALATVYNIKGQYEKALDVYERGMAVDPSDGLMVHNATYVKGFKPTDAFIEKTRAKYEACQVLQHKIYLATALARCLEKQKDYDGAFQYYEAANTLHLKVFPHDKEKTKLFFKKLKETFSREFIEESQVQNSTEKTPIFILGMPRSGTTLIEQIISSHSQVDGGGELPLMPEIVQKALPANADATPELSEEQLQKLAEYYLKRLEAKGFSALYVTDKLPGNYNYIGMIRMMFPHAKIIHCMRDPMDTCLSIYKQCFYGTHSYRCDQTSLGQTYRTYQEIMAHWESVLPEDAILDVAYEDVVKDSEAQIRRILEFCGLNWEEDCLNFHENSKEIRTASISQARQPIYKDSIGGWQNYEQYVAPLQEALGDAVK